MTEAGPVQTISAVVPVFQGERTLEALTAELVPLTSLTTTPAGNSFRLTELIFVHDGAVDGSHRVLEELGKKYPFVTTLWLSRNYGQHPATLAGIAGTSSDWVVTLDEDGQHNPQDSGRLLDVAIAQGGQVVYSQPTNEPPHGWLRNRASDLAKWFFGRLSGNRDFGRFSSFRLLQGEIARALAAYCGNTAYLDVALSWVAAKALHCPVRHRAERGRPSGYRFRDLLAHFWQLVLTSGTRPLRFIALLGATAIVVSLGLTAYVLWEKFRSAIPVQGWTSLFLVVSFFSGLILLSLSIIAEYLGVAVSMAMGKPLYLIVSKPVPGVRRTL